MGFSKLFGKIKPNQIGVGVPDDARRLLSFLHASVTGDKLQFKFRSSALPFCPRAYSLLVTLPREDLPDRVDGFLDDATLSTGHNVHAVLQRWLGQSGVLFGNWKCRVCGYFVEWSTQKKCRNKTCELYRKNLEYVEVDMVDPETGCTAHIDGLFINGRDELEGIEIKTATQHKLEAQGEPKEQHQYFQAATYAKLFNQQHGRKTGYRLRYFNFFYIAKNLPHSYVVKYQRHEKADFGVVDTKWAGKFDILRVFRRRMDLRKIDRYFEQVKVIWAAQKKHEGKLLPRQDNWGFCRKQSDGQFCSLVRLCFSSKVESMPTVSARKLPIIQDPYDL